MRIAVIPVILALFFTTSDAWILLRNTLFMLAATTDFMDGFLARHYNQMSRLGQLMDPLADKLLTLPCLIILMVQGYIPPSFFPAALLIIMREICVPTLRERVMERTGKNLPSSPLAQWKTCLLMVAIAGLMSVDLLSAHMFFITQKVSLWVLAGAAGLSLISFWGYLRQTLKAMA